jgi:hypothetical protein
MVADMLRLALTRMFNKVRELLSKARDVRFVSVPSGVSAKPAMRGHFKTGHVRWPGTDPFYPAFS